MKIILLLILVSFNCFAEEVEVKAETKQEVKEVLTDEDKEILRRGQITNGRRITAGIIGSTVGFGIGHAIAGKYKSKGWMFTVTESIAGVVLLNGMAECLVEGIGDSWDDEDDDDEEVESCDNDNFTYGMIATVGLRIWEAIDIWTSMSHHNRRHAELTESETKSSVFIIPALQKGRAGLKLVYSF